MPTYEYRCKACGDETEVVQSFTDDALTTCTACGGTLRKLFGNVGIAFKGSGFYKNDSRSKPAAAGKNGSEKSTADSGASSADKTSSDAGSSSNGDAGSSAKKKEPATAGSGASAKPDAPKTPKTSKSG